MTKVLFWVVEAILKVVSYSPFWLLYLLSDMLFLLLFHVLKYRRKVVQANLINSFPDKSLQELNTIEKRFYRHLADIIMESVKSFSISSSELKERYKMDNLEAITDPLKSGRSVIAVSGHYGNWEWGPLAIAPELSEDVLIVYKPLSNHRFDKLITSVRSRFGAVMVPMKQTLRKVAEYKNEPHVLVLVGDQTPTREESKYFTAFLNQPTAVFLGVEKTAQKLDYSIVYFHVKRIKRGYYICTINTLVDQPKETLEFEITELHTRELEKQIKHQPENWLWSHKRWKFKPEDVLNQ